MKKQILIKTKMKKMKRSAIIFALVIGVSGLVISCGGASTKDKKVNETTENEKPAPGSFDDIINGSVPVIVDFYATWCKPCKVQSPIIDEIEAELGDKVKVIKIDVDVETDLSERYGIESIPTIMIFKDGKTIFEAVGVQEKEVLTKVVLDAQ
jgi:thioredoxin 1